MDNPGYVALTRMKGLSDEMRVLANNVANAATTGFRSEGLVFAEVLVEAEVDGGALAMAAPRAHLTDARQGGMTPTGGRFDLAIMGDGFFQVQTPEGPRLTRAGAFLPDAQGVLVNAEGHPVLDAGGAPIQLPPDADAVLVGADGAISADGQQVGQIGLFTAAPEALLRETGTRFRLDGAPDPAPDAVVRQGFLEDSNVSPVEQIARLVELQRAYELGQSFLSQEDDRIRDAVRTLGRAS